MSFLHVNMKTCTKCKKTYPKDAFYKQSPGCRNKAKDGLHSWCKKCFLAAVLKYDRTPEGRYVEIKRDAKRRHKKFTLSVEDVKALSGRPCAYCGRGIKVLALDRVDNSKGYTKENVVQCCKWCNFTKGTGSVKFFYNQCKRIAENMPESYKKIGRVDGYGDRYKDAFA